MLGPRQLLPGLGRKLWMQMAALGLGLMGIHRLCLEETAAAAGLPRAPDHC